MVWDEFKSVFPKIVKLVQLKPAPKGTWKSIVHISSQLHADITLVVWSQPWWQYSLHRCHQTTNQVFPLHP